MQFTHKAIPGKTSLALALLALGGMTMLPARADVITFDDLPNTSDFSVISSPYHGLTWNHFDYQNSTYLPNTGYPAGTISGTNVAFNEAGNPASIVDSSGTFTLTSTYLTAAWYDGLNVQIIGRDKGVTLFTTMVTPSATAPTLENLNWSGINEVDFVSSGGTLHPGYTSGSGTQFVLDNVTINAAAVPEPSAIAPFLIGSLSLGGLALSARRRKAKSAE